MWTHALPDRLLAAADVTGSGELIWPKAEALAVVRLLPTLEIGLIGLEAFVPVGSARMFLHWDWTFEAPWDGRAPWTRFAETASGTAAHVLGRRPTRPDEAYFIAACGRRAYLSAPAGMGRDRE